MSSKTLRPIPEYIWLDEERTLRTRRRGLLLAAVMEGGLPGGGSVGPRRTGSTGHFLTGEVGAWQAGVAIGLFEQPGEGLDAIFESGQAADHGHVIPAEGGCGVQLLRLVGLAFAKLVEPAGQVLDAPPCSSKD